MCMMKGLVIATFLLTTASCQQELFKNPNFEEAFNGEDNWFCFGNCSLQKASDAFNGSQSGEVTGRTGYLSGISQYVPLQPLRTYRFTLQLKVLNQQPGALYHAVDLAFVFDDAVEGENVTWATSPYMRQAEGWTTVGGDCIMPVSVDKVRFALHFPDPEINYRVDAASLKEIVANNNWRQEADARIETLRKRDIEIRFTADPAFDPQDITIEVQQTRSGFPFGSTIEADLIGGQGARAEKYQSVFYENFEMATIENALKWQNMEPIKGRINYERPERAIDALRSRGVVVRGHCVAWSVEKWVPRWQLPMNGTEIRQEVTRRINYVVDYFKDRLIHWDVNNEQIHGDFYEQKTQDPHYTHDMFRQIQRVDPNVKLFFNEYNILGSDGEATYAYAWSVKKAIEMGVPVDRVGLQGHFQFHSQLLVDSVWERLNVAASVGLPIWITEMDVEEEDRAMRADGYEDLLRLFFSHPSVEGIVLWGFWDQAHWRPNAALFEGDDLTPNAAGLRYMQLVKQTWRTNATLRPNSRSQTFQIRGFHGDYEVKVIYQSQEVSTQQFTLSKGTGAHVVNVQI